jgi:hypothetical protein
MLSSSIPVLESTMPLLEVVPLSEARIKTTGKTRAMALLQVVEF